SWRLIFFDGIDEMFDFEQEGLGVCEIGRKHIAHAVGQLKFAESFRRAQRDAAIVNFHFFAGLGVVVADHALRTDNASTAHFVGGQPTDFTRRDGAARELEPQVGDITLRFLDTRTTKGASTGGKFTEPVEQDGNVVNGKIPDHIDVLLVETKVDARKTEVVKAADLTGINELFHSHHGRAVNKGVPGHQDAAAAECQIDQPVGVF